MGHGGDGSGNCQLRELARGHRFGAQVLERQERVRSLGICGNGGEWVNDWYDAHYYENAPGSDPQRPTEGRQKVHRGGGYNCNRIDIRVSTRHFLPPTSYMDYIGFRCAMDDDQDQ